jgi:precorrin-4/cobalt-precorrin-4 C11-methyltransferase
MRQLVTHDIAYEIVPGVPAFAAAAAALGRELTLPDIAQTVILTRTSVRASDMPPGEELATLAQSHATLAIHLSINNLVPVVRELTPYYGADCPAVIAYRVSWPDQQIVQGTLADIRDKVKPLGITRTALILVGPALATDLDTEEAFANSQLYDPSHHHVLRPRKTE